MPSLAARFPREAQRLVSLAQSLAESSSRLEEVYWEKLLSAQLNKLLQGRPNNTVEQTLDALLAQAPEAYDVLAAQAEAVTEATTIVHQSQAYDVLLVAAPVLIWTRYRLPNVTMDASVQETIRQHISEHIMAPQTHIAMVPTLLCADQLPRSFQDVLHWTQRLGRQALGLSVDPYPLRADSDNSYLLADARFLTFALVARKGEPLFRWQTPVNGISPTRDTCMQHWQAHSQKIIAPLFTGCQTEVLLPNAFYVSNREADRGIRPLVVTSALTWLQTITAIDASDLRATIVACGEDQIEEFRIGICTTTSHTVIYGCVWPVLSAAEANLEAMPDDKPDVPAQITTLLKTLGIQQIKRLPGLFPPETCDDCGDGHHFPNPLGEMHYPELPKGIQDNPVSLH